MNTCGVDVGIVKLKIIQLFPDLNSLRISCNDSSVHLCPATGGSQAALNAALASTVPHTKASRRRLYCLDNLYT